MARNPKHWEDKQGGGESPEEDLVGDTQAHEGMTHEQLDSLARARGVDLPTGANKAEKVAAING